MGTLAIHMYALCTHCVLIFNYTSVSAENLLFCLLAHSYMLLIERVLDRIRLYGFVALCGGEAGCCKIDDGAHYNETNLSQLQLA